MSDPRHLLVTLGDSLTQGFLSGAVHRTELAYPVWVAAALGRREQFTVADFRGEGGLPLNLERLLRKISAKMGKTLEWWDRVPALARAQAILDAVDGYWERGRGALPLAQPAPHHNLSVWGFELLDALTLSESACRRALPKPHADLSRQIPEMAMYRTARRVLNPSFAPESADWTALDCAGHLAEEGGIENLVVALGTHNALGAMTSLAVRPSESADLHRLAHERECNLWRPEHFATLFARLADEVDALGAARVFVATVPHVTIAPVTRGVSPNGGYPRDGYFEYYTRPWIWDDEFDPGAHPHLTGDAVRAVDRCVDAYNETIRREAAARRWHLFDVCALFDSIAFRRHRGQPPFKWPRALTVAVKANPRLSYLSNGNGAVHLDTRFLRTDPERPGWLRQGGLFSLDGIHPTTIGYGLIADLLLKTMKQAGAAPKSAEIDWRAVLAADTLINDPPALLDDLHQCLRFVASHAGLGALLELW